MAETGLWMQEQMGFEIPCRPVNSLEATWGPQGQN